MPKAALLACTLLICGCFRGLDAVQPDPVSAPSFSLQVRDVSRATWNADNAPRAPVFVLDFAATPPADAAARLLLLRGAASEEIIEQLRSTKRKQVIEESLVALSVERSAMQVAAQPVTPLLKGAAYTLVWVDDGGGMDFAIRVSSSPAAGAELVDSLPAPLEQQVAPNLRRALLRFDGYVSGPLESLVKLRDATGNEVTSSISRAACESLGLGAGDCVQITPEHPLAAATRHSVSIEPGLTDATGAPLSARELAFETAAHHDTAVPQLLAVDCAKDEVRVDSLCVLTTDTTVSIRARSDEPAMLNLVLPPALASSLGKAGDHLLEAPLLHPTKALLVLSDAAGNRRELPLSLEPASDLPTLSIVEVRADPLGKEPDQEYVELLNFGDQAVSLMGFTLTSDPFREGQRLAGSFSIEPGQRVLLVPPEFDVQDTTDGAPPAGARLVRLSAALALKNDGAPLFLRDARGRRVSASPALSPQRAGQCIVRADSSFRSGKPDSFVVEPGGSCTPGFGSDAEQP